MTPKIFISTVPFGEASSLPCDLLKQQGFDFQINPLGRRLQECELIEMLSGCSVLLAGTEKIGRAVFASCPDLRLISRVGIGLDNVNLNAARDHGVKVAYTPDAPSQAVSELAIGLIFSLLRNIVKNHMEMGVGRWTRDLGWTLADRKIGVVGYGRIGRRVTQALLACGAREVYVADRKEFFEDDSRIKFIPLQLLFKTCNLISLHVPLDTETFNLINPETVNKMPKGTVIVNTSRGGIVNEEAVVEALGTGQLAGVALDVFRDEPDIPEILYSADNLIMTSHIGSMARSARIAMQTQAVEAAISFLQGKHVVNFVPDEEYANQQLFLEQV